VGVEMGRLQIRYRFPKLMRDIICKHNDFLLETQFYADRRNHSRAATRPD
jgi:hypothetical protein